MEIINSLNYKTSIFASINSLRLVRYELWRAEHVKNIRRHINEGKANILRTLDFFLSVQSVLSATLAGILGFAEAPIQGNENQYHQYGRPYI